MENFDEQVTDENQVPKVAEQKAVEQKVNVQKAEKGYTGFEVIGERGEFGYLGLMWHHDHLELETAIMLVKAGYSGIKLV